jgi:hypothetical protein
MESYNERIDSYKDSLQAYINSNLPGFTFDDALKNITFTISPITESIGVWINPQFAANLTKEQHVDLLFLAR